LSAGERLARGLEQMGISCTLRQLEALENHRSELERWNRAYGLVKASGEELVVRHFLDSLAGLPVIIGLHPRRTLLDVGSGAGFPGIPLAVFMADCEVTLLERSSRRAAFLTNVILLLGLRHVRVEEKQLAELTGRFDLVTLRGFSPLARELDDLLRVLSPEGHLVAYKGRRERVLAELRAAGVGEGEAAVHPLQVPFLEAERHLVIINSLTKPGGRATI
jgi:16S rRNA (guanine527-N7)-methyltransferase